MKPIIPTFAKISASVVVAGLTLPTPLRAAPEESTEAAEKKYVSEAPLPKGWPEPGPFGKVSEKAYPAYRGAYTSSDSESGAFWRLFQHIKERSIPMTAPVEMTMRANGEDGSLAQAEMGFLYVSTATGETGEAGQLVEVRDVPSVRVISFAFQGDSDDKKMAEIKQQLAAYAKENSLTISGFRLLGYNGPMTPDARKSWELQAIVSEKIIESEKE